MSRARVAKPVLRGDTRRQIREYVAERDGRQCHYCRAPFGEDLTGVTLDHYIPYCLWPMNKPRNIVLACVPCNQRKADALPLTLAWLLCRYSVACRPLTRAEVGEAA
ncbi:HNH endonuclease [Streptomyces albus subsp. chlorinus]|uniref:HNH endonuclease n=1 Tax=Streptomyces albus TaxID=1888 RepID=UPI001570E8D1|nr:HNH endonuclease [Streptomyces albus]NSC21362.1 HNH endonuclease [Streptomyces albus subsp. chlorinus]